MASRARNTLKFLLSAEARKTRAMWVTNFLIYSAHFLSCWGNRMWHFGMGMFLVKIANDTIQLSATFGLASGLAVFFFGALIGDWIDNTPRLKAAQISLVLQDVLMLGCAIVVICYLGFKDSIPESNTWLLPLLQTVFVILGVVSHLAAQARIIAVERDWVVEICGKDKDYLASMTAMLRRIDQISMILAPMATGQVMTFMGLVYGAIFISGWNLLSVFAEFYLTWKVYNTVPALKAMKDVRRNAAVVYEEKVEEGTVAETGADNAKATEARLIDNAKATEACLTDRANTSPSGTKDSNRCITRVSDVRLLYQFITLYRGWRTYINYSVAVAGLSLAFLYMTVLDFHNITVAYVVTQGLSGSVVGILQGSSAVFGIMGTFAYPIMRRHFGLNRTGFIALSCQVSSLTLCVISVWMPGSPFDPFYQNTPQIPEQCRIADLSTPVLQTSTFPTAINSSSLNITDMDNNSTLLGLDCEELTKRTPDSYLSVGFLMAGIFLSRFGLWIADLTITQMFLENILPNQRGIVNGVQNSINQLMDLLKYAMVVALPDTETFGIIIIISFCSIATAWVLLTIYLRRQGTPLCVCCKSQSQEIVDNQSDNEQALSSIMDVKSHPDPQVGDYVNHEESKA